MEEQLANNPLYQELTWIGVSGRPCEEGNYIVYYEYDGYSEDGSYDLFVAISWYDKCEGFTDLEFRCIPLAYIAIDPYALQILDALKRERERLNERSRKDD